MNNDILDDANESLKLPYEFEVNKKEWHQKIDDLIRKSTIGSSIILTICLILNVVLNIRAPTLVLLAVLIMLYISKRKESTELRTLGGNKYVIGEDEISNTSPSEETITISINDIKKIQKYHWGIEIESNKKAHKTIRIPSIVSRYNMILAHFRSQNLLSE